MSRKYLCPFLVPIMFIILNSLSACSFLGFNGSNNSQAYDSKVVTKVEMFQHVIAPGETLGMISSWYTGKTSNWEEIHLSNPNIDPKKMLVGEVILIPMYLVIRQDSLPRSVVESQRVEPKVEENNVDKVKTERKRLLEELFEK